MTPRSHLTVKSPAGRERPRPRHLVPIRGPELRDSDRKENLVLVPGTTTRARVGPCRPPARKPRRTTSSMAKVSRCPDEGREQGPKRMKISCLKPENSPGASAKGDELVVCLDEILSLPDKLGIQWKEEAFLGSTCKVPLAHKAKTVQKKLVLQAIAGCSRMEGSAVSKQDQGTAGGTAVKPVPIVLAPIKTLQKTATCSKKRSIEGNKKRAKGLLRNLATTVGKFRAATSDTCQNLFVEKKRKKYKTKHM
ncbi:hypothetical protein PR048_006655 [Dryococelus australis]|uniref:Uncharacterized protein n=1 Tax=Dryococelus australis TaxID=614101 RepID=A0ABQ9IBJ2_9NEOP|nr:hypothetical protein PR048_006655 [Dryococelus australis]